MAADDSPSKISEMAPKKADPKTVSVDQATIQMLQKAQADGCETIFDRAVTMKACNIGEQGTCCKACAQGPCRLPLPKKGIEGIDTRKGLCGATPETIAARNFARMIAAGSTAHSDHSKGVAKVFLAAARKEAPDYKLKDTEKLLEIAPYFNVPTTEVIDGVERQRDIYEIAVEVGETAPSQWGQQEGEILYAKRAPEARYELWKKLGVIPKGIDTEIVNIMHRTHMGCDQDYKNIIKQCSRAALADGWAGSMMGTDLQDVLFGTPYPIQGEINLGVLKPDYVNVLVYDHEPLLSEMIVIAAQDPELIEYAKTKGAKGIVLAGNYLLQELAIVTGCVDAVIVDVQCIMENIANVAKCYHTEIITTDPRGMIESGDVHHMEFDEHHALADAKRIVKSAIDNYPNRKSEPMVPKAKEKMVVGFSAEAISYHLGGTFRGSYVPLSDNIINGRIRGIAGVVGCNNARSVHDSVSLTLIKELLKNDVIVLTTGCSAMACGKAGLLSPESAKVFCGPGLAEVCETVGIPPVLHVGACVDNSRILVAATEVVKAGGLGKDISDLPVTGAPRFQKHLFEELEDIYGGKWDLVTDPYEMAAKMIAHIDKKRKALGLDKAKERVLMDMADRQKLDAA